MRTEKEMLDLIIKTAETDPRIRAAYLEGSRANPQVPRDMFQDYDVVYIVTETLPYRKERQWIDRFGQRLYMQYPEDNNYYPSDVENYYGWLIQFADGNRLDLHVCTEAYALNHLELYLVLLDKDGIMPQQQETSDQCYWVKQPDEDEFQFVCNEFWWCLNNVAKGLWREELPYIMDMLDVSVRPMLKRLLEWKVGCEYQFSVSVGKSGKYLKKYLQETTYHRFLATYSAAEIKAVWKAVICMCELFWEIEGEVGRALGFTCNWEEAENSLNYLKYVQGLSADAEDIY